MAKINDEDGDANTDALKLLLKLILFVYILGQDGGQERLILLSLGALLIFLAQTGRLDFLSNFAFRLPNFTERPRPEPRPEVVPAAPGDAELRARLGLEPRPPANAAEEAALEQQQRAEEGTVLNLLRDIESVVGAFFASLWPSWRAREQDLVDEIDRAHQAVNAGPGAAFG